MSQARFGRMWWQKGISVALSCAMVVATTPVAALAEKLTAAEDEPVAVELTEDVEGAEAVDAAEPAGDEGLLEDEVAAEETEPSEPEAAPAEAEPDDAVVLTPEADTVDLPMGEDPVLEPQNSTVQRSFSLNDTWRSADVDMAYTDWQKIINENLDPSRNASYDYWLFSVEKAGMVTISVRATSADIEWIMYDRANTNENILGPVVQLGATDGSNTIEKSVWLEEGSYAIMVYSSLHAKDAGNKYNVKGKFEDVGRRDIGKATFNGKAGASISSLGKKAYTGAAIKPALKVAWEGQTLTEGVDYTVEYQNNTKVGTASAIVKGKGRYANSSKTLTFRIVKKSIKKCKVSVPVQPWTGKAVKAKPVVKIGKTVLKRGTDYKIVKYTKNKNVGTATVTIKGKGGLKGTRTVKFKIRYNLAENGAVIGYYKPGTTTFTRFIFKKTNKQMKKGRDYKMRVVKGKDGKKMYEMTGKGKYAGTIYFSFK